MGDEVAFDDEATRIRRVAEFFDKQVGGGKERKIEFALADQRANEFMGAAVKTIGPTGERVECIELHAGANTRLRGNERELFVNDGRERGEAFAKLDRPLSRVLTRQRVREASTRRTQLILERHRFDECEKARDLRGRGAPRRKLGMTMIDKTGAKQCQGLQAGLNLRKFLAGLFESGPCAAGQELAKGGSEGHESLIELIQVGSSRVRCRLRGGGRFGLWCHG